MSGKRINQICIKFLFSFLTGTWWIRDNARKCRGENSQFIQVNSAVAVTRRSHSSQHWLLSLPARFDASSSQIFVSPEWFEQGTVEALDSKDCACRFRDNQIGVEQQLEGEKMCEHRHSISSSSSRRRSCFSSSERFVACFSIHL